MIPFPTQRVLYEALLRYDDAAFRHLYRLQYGRVAEYVWREGGSSLQAKELLHETIIAFLFQLKNPRYQWRDEAELTTYLTAIAQNIWRHQQRKARQLQALSDDLPDDSEEEADAELIFETRRIDVEQALAQLGEKCRQSIQLHYWQRESMKEIARLLGWANEAVARKEKSRCLKSLRAKLSPRP